ncbi:MULTISPECIES: hypothetical protein [Streptomyces]|uniref:Uncharacterized protein n=1 Tax=Streptomyces cuspidosporus TaxID=66882 RepID=A0ABN3GSV5_9ACTN
MKDRQVLESGAISRMSLEDVEAFLSEASRPYLTAQSWSAMRDFCVGRMQNRSLPDGQRIRWGDLAVQAARLKFSEGGVNELDAAGEEVLSRSYMIENFGPGEPCSARDPRALVLYSVEKIGCERDEVSRRADGWDRLPVPEILFLRRVKNILRPLKKVVGCLEEGSLREDLNAWLALIPRLP